MVTHQGKDLILILEDPDLSLDRAMNLLEYYYLELQKIRRELPYDEDTYLYDKIQTAKSDAIIDNSAASSKPKPNNLNYIEPSEDGYAGLGPPLG